MTDIAVKSTVSNQKQAAVVARQCVSWDRGDKTKEDHLSCTTTQRRKAGGHESAYAGLSIACYADRVMCIRISYLIRTATTRKLILFSSVKMIAQGSAQCGARTFHAAINSQSGRLEGSRPL